MSAGSSDEPYSHEWATHHHRGEPWAPSAGPGGALTNPLEKLTTFHPRVTSINLNLSAPSFLSIESCSSNKNAQETHIPRVEITGPLVRR